MNKEQALESIQKAREYHELQMFKIKALLQGEEVNDPTSVNKQECKFGQWLYNEENKVQKLLGDQFYKNIEQTHAKWHIEYARIFEIFFTDKKRSFISKMIGSTKVKTMELDKAKLYHAELLKTTHELLQFLGASERRISALADSKFN